MGTRRNALLLAGCLAVTACAESPDACLARVTDPAGRASSARALALSRAAPSERPARVLLVLDDPPFDFGAYTSDPSGLQAARTRQLAPLQAPLLDWLRDREAREVSPFWLANMVAALLGAGDLGDALCAPGVRWIEVADGWYEVVTPPWDPLGLGPGECPIVDGRCPEHCADVPGRALDGPTRCAPSARIVACSRQETFASNGQPQCRVEVATGHRYVFRGQAPGSPAFVGWRACTAAEWSTPDTAPAPGCP